MYNFQANWVKILKVLKELGSEMDYLHQIRKPKLRDKEHIAIDLTSEYMSIDSECQLFRILPIDLSDKIEHSVYNRGKRKLFPFRESLRKEIGIKVELVSALLYCWQHAFRSL
ncbi:hypothetical protein GCM10022393_11940 [Aquimarina addita]|uniref:Transposase n=1 Tax=Aquimarina addita TaxID=870485 RepID=A0ABP7XEC3_9FLAO